MDISFPQPVLVFSRAGNREDELADPVWCGAEER